MGQLTTIACVAIALLLSGAAFNEGGIVTGTVIDGSANDQTLSAAVVTLTSTGLGGSRSTLTDQSGGFRFTDVPAGDIRLAASKSAYLSGSYGSLLPGRSGVGIALAAGERLDGMRIRLLRGAVIGGTISFAGEPASGISVLALPAVPRRGSPSPVATATDSMGRYRFSGLMPGPYVIVASLSASGGAETVTQASDETGKSQVLKQYLLPPTFYPGVTSVSTAMLLTVDAATETLGIDFEIRPVPSANITGQIVAPGIASSDLAVQLCSPGPIVPLSFRSGTNVTIRDNGQFEIVGVTPGRYTLEAHTRSASQGAGLMSAGSMPVTMTGGDLAGLVLPLGRSGSIRGTLTAGRTVNGQAPNFADARVTLVDRDEANSCLVGRSPQLSGRITAQGTFLIQGIPRGRYGVSLIAPGSDWWLASVSVDQRKAPGNIVDISGDVESALSLAVTNGESGIAGILQVEKNIRIDDLAVVIFSVDQELWFYGSPGVRLARPDPDGRYRIDKVPAGRYSAAVVSGVDGLDLEDLSILRMLQPSAAAVEVVLGRTVVLDLRAVGSN